MRNGAPVLWTAFCAKVLCNLSSCCLFKGRLSLWDAPCNTASCIDFMCSQCFTFAQRLIFHAFYKTLNDKRLFSFFRQSTPLCRCTRNTHNSLEKWTTRRKTQCGKWSLVPVLRWVAYFWGYPAFRRTYSQYSDSCFSDYAEEPAFTLPKSSWPSI